MGHNVLETQEISDVLDFVDRKTVVLFDVDNTLIEPIENQGSEVWERYIYQKNLEVGLSTSEALLKARKYWKTIQEKISVRLVDVKTKMLLQILRKNKTTVFAITSRSVGLEKITQTQLASVDIHLPLSHHNIEEIFFPLDDFSSHKNGILYCGNNQKSKVFFRFYEYLETKIDRIIFVDDKRYHVNDMGETASMYGLSYVGLRYSKTDQREKLVQRELDSLSNEQFFEMTRNSL